VSCKSEQSPPTSINETANRQNIKAANYNVQLGLGYLKQGNMTRAKKKLVIALNQAPNLAEANAAMGYFLEMTGQYPKAADYYQKSLRLASNKGPQYNNYGAFLCRRGQYKEAETMFIKASQDISYANSPAALENAGLCAVAASDFKSAESFFQKALQQDPRRLQSLSQLITLDLKNGNSNAAKLALQKYRPFITNSYQIDRLNAKINAFDTKKLATAKAKTGGIDNDKHIS